MELQLYMISLSSSNFDGKHAINSGPQWVAYSTCTTYACRRLWQGQAELGWASVLFTISALISWCTQRERVKKCWNISAREELRIRFYRPGAVSKVESWKRGRGNSQQQAWTNGGRWAGEQASCMGCSRSCLSIIFVWENLLCLGPLVGWSVWSLIALEFPPVWPGEEMLYGFLCVFIIMICAPLRETRVYMVLFVFGIKNTHLCNTKCGVKSSICQGCLSGWAAQDLGHLICISPHTHTSFMICAKIRHKPSKVYRGEDMHECSSHVSMWQEESVQKFKKLYFLPSNSSSS